MAVATDTTLEEVKKIAKGRGVEFFFAQFVDMYGRPSAKLIPAANLDDLANDVAAAVRQQDSVAQEIARNASAAAKGTRDVSDNVSEGSSSAVRTGQVAKTVLTAAGELGEQSLLLRQEVERYLAQVRVA